MSIIRKRIRLSIELIFAIKYIYFWILRNRLRNYTNPTPQTLIQESFQ